MDAGAKQLLTQRDFDRAWFQLADAHTTGVSAELYAEWILTKAPGRSWNPKPNRDPSLANAQLQPRTGTVP